MDKPKAPSTRALDLGIEALTELTLNLRWAWHHGTDKLWAELDPELWALTQNPWVVLQTVSRSKLSDLLARPEYRTRVTSLLAQRRSHLASPARFQQRHPQSPLTRVAYFSMEFALSEALPTYSGGLGFMEDKRCAFDVALAVTRAGNLFITQTPVPAGFDRFSPELIDLYLRRYAEDGLGLSVRNCLAVDDVIPPSSEA